MWQVPPFMTKSSGWHSTLGLTRSTVLAFELHPTSRSPMINAKYMFVSRLYCGMHLNLQSHHLAHLGRHIWAVVSKGS